MSHCNAYGASEAHGHLEPMMIERRALRPDDVAIDIAYCGVCHTDAHVVNNDWGTSVFPCVPGHEIVGHVTAVGPEVEPLESQATYILSPSGDTTTSLNLPMPRK